MCGRYVLSMRPSVVRSRLVQIDMPSDDGPSDDDERLRQTYNFAPGYYGLIYRAATNDRGTDNEPLGENADANEEGPSPKKARLNAHGASMAKSARADGMSTAQTKYKLQTAKWGLIPFWTRRPNERSIGKTINCRDDSLRQDSGMWMTMKQRKRCIVIAEGFYEWLKKNGSKTKIPHYIKRKDGQLMCFAGLWDCVQYEDSDEKVYSYTIITTDRNSQLKFLHDRMPVILEPGSEEMRKWLNPRNIGWSKELQDILKPFDGELDCYQVHQDVGKIGNNSPNFVIPIDSKENKSSITHFFGVQKPERKDNNNKKLEKDENEDRETAVKVEDSESNAPMPVPQSESEESFSRKFKTEVEDNREVTPTKETVDGDHHMSVLSDDDLLEAERSLPKKVYRYESFDSRPIKAPNFGKAYANAKEKTSGS